MSNVIFLDFDGPLIPGRCCHYWARNANEAPYYDYPDLFAAAQIARVCEEAPASIVVSSTWRANEKESKNLLERAGLLSYLHEDWRTALDKRKLTVFDTDGVRESKIKDWLARHPETERWVAIDDCKLNLPNFICVDYYDGMLWQHYLELERHMGMMSRPNV